MDYLIYWLIVFCNLYRRILSNADFLSIRRGPQRRRRDWLCHSWWVFLAHRQCLFTSFPYWELTPLFDSGKPLELKPQDSRSWRFSHRDVLKTWRRSYPRPKICTKPFLQQLHWLPFRQRVEFKLAVLVFKVLNVLPPSFLSDNCQLVSGTSRRQLQSSSVQTCALQRTTIHVWEIGLLLLQDSDCGRVSQQNCNNLTSPSDNSAGRERRICSADGCDASWLFVLCCRV